MTLDEAIQHAREVANEQKRRSGICIQNDSECDKFSDCLKCAEEHEQLAEWLEELKALKNGLDIKCDNLNEDLEKGKKIGYNKAIDDFKSRLEERILAGKMIDEKFAYIDNCDIDEIAERLKAGGDE